MKRIILHGEMADLFAPQIDLVAETFQDILDGLSSNFINILLPQ